jgi:nonsense-mediated mRNA decay protein 3
MGIKDRFCPKCGRPSEGQGLCDHCRVDKTRWFSCDARVQSIHCPGCGAMKQGNTWTDTDRDRTLLAHEIARSAVHFHPDVRKAHLDIRIDDLSTNRSRAILSFKGILYDKVVEGRCETEIAWRREQCDRCNRISGSYYEGVVQVRAQDRLPSPYEIQLAAAIASEIEESLQTGGERLSFVSDVTETRDGLDIVIGSQHIGLLISRKITSELGGRFTTHPKLVGEKDGRQLFRITYSVRLPRFQKRDVIRFHGRYGEIIQVDPRNMRVFDFTDGTVKTVRENEVEKLIGNARIAEVALVAFSSGNTIGVIDPATFTTHECVAGASLRNIQAGNHVRILRHGDHFVVLG